MAKDPAFLFYPGDWLGGTLGMSFEEKGAYMELLMMQFNTGHMTEHMIVRMIGHHWDILKVKFKQDDKGLWYNVRLDEEKEKRKNFVNSRKNNIKGENQFTKVNHKTKPKKGHMTSHMENENVNDNEDVIIIKKSKLEIFEELFSDEVYISDLSQTHRGKDIKQAFEECYTHHSNAPNPPRELWQWRQKLNTWLTIKAKENVKRTNNKQQHTNSIKDTIRNTYGNIGGE